MKKSGFTIIELLFVIAIIGVMIALGLSYYQREETNFKIKKSALQFQHILQAASTYSVEKNKWPDLGNTDKTNTSPFYEFYIGHEIAQNPWGASSYQYYPPTGSETRFSVDSNVPCEVAQRIAALLPIAVAGSCTNGLANVKSYISSGKMSSWVKILEYNVSGQTWTVVLTDEDWHKHSDPYTKTVVKDDNSHIFDCPKERLILIPFITQVGFSGNTFLLPPSKDAVFGVATGVLPNGCESIPDGKTRCTITYVISVGERMVGNKTTGSFGYLALCKGVPP